MRTKLAACLFAFAVATAALADTGALLQLVDYIGVDYGGAVENGAVVNEFEYAEMVEFARLAGHGVAALPESPQKAGLAADARELAALIARKGPPAEVAALTHRMRDGLMRAYPGVLTPRVAPDLARGAQVYASQCASCHGDRGRGDGPAAATLDPPPIDFHDVARARQRSVYGLYSAITLGVQGTGMASFAHLSDADRWALAFLVGGMHADEPTLAAGQAAVASGTSPSLREAITLTPNELAGGAGAGPAVAAYLRRHPEVLFAAAPDPIDVALDRLGASVAAYESGAREEAGRLAVAAYLDGFELTEASLTTVAPALVRTLEERMLGFRALLASDVPAPEVSARAGEIATLLERARDARDEEPLSGAVAFTSSLVILLREGLEAILLLGAIVAVLVRTGRREALRWVHVGWIAALVAGVATWGVATWVIAISGAARELTEGVTALLAAAILFYVGFWMHDKVHAQRWNRFLKEKVQRALDDRTLVGIAVVSFLAVFREVFETVLFYQALWAQVAEGGRSALLAGAATAAVALLLLAWGIFTFGLKVPLRQFFAASAAVMFLLAIVFVGKGVVALQEAGRLPISPIEFPRIELLGVYPTLQSLAAQLALVLLALALVWWNGRGVRPAAVTAP
jgi:high-affinity iron transporter